MRRFKVIQLWVETATEPLYSLHLTGNFDEMFDKISDFTETTLHVICQALAERFHKETGILKTYSGLRLDPGMCVLALQQVGTGQADKSTVSPI